MKQITIALAENGGYIITVIGNQVTEQMSGSIRMNPARSYVSTDIPQTLDIIRDRLNEFKEV